MKNLPILCVAACCACAWMACTTIQPATPTTPAPAPAPTWPNEAFRKKPPTPGAQPAVTIPTVNTFALNNGVRVYLVENHELPTVTMRLRMNLGSMHDPKGKEGLNSTAMSLLAQGPSGMTTSEYEGRKADLGAQIGIGGGTHTSALTVRSLKQQAELSLDLGLSVLLNPGVRQDDFDRIQAQIQASLAQQVASPGTIARRLYTSLIYGAKHPYSKIPTSKSLSRMTLKDCKSYVKKLSPAGAELFVIGDITAAEVKALWNPRMANWRAKGNPKRIVIGDGGGPGGGIGAPSNGGRIIVPGQNKGGGGGINKNTPPPKPRNGTVFFVDVPGAVQSTIMVGHPGPTRQAKDYAANMLMAQILGGSFTSRINMNLREKNGFAYGARAGFRYMRNTGYFVASSSVKSDKTGPALREVAKEIQLMRNEAPKSEELEREASGHVLTMPAWFATSNGTMNTFANLAFYGLPLSYFDGYQDKIAAIDTAQVLSSAKKYLRDNGYTVLVVGDAATVLADLQNIANEGVFGPNKTITLLNTDGELIKR